LPSLAMRERYHDGFSLSARLGKEFTWNKH